MRRGAQTGSTPWTKAAAELHWTASRSPPPVEGVKRPGADGRTGLPPYAERMISNNRYSMMDCLMCDKDGPHYQYSPDKEDVFQCSQCFAMFTDSSPKWSA